MSEKWTRYNATTGEIEGVYVMPISRAEEQDFPLILGEYDATEYYVDVITEAPVQIPASPSAYHKWNILTKEWQLVGSSVLLKRLATLRWNIETGGYTWNGWPVHSDDRAQAKAMGELLRINAGQRTDGEQWKFADGEFRPLTNLEFLAMFSAGSEHVKKCFAVEDLCKTRVEAGEYDIAAIWAEEWGDL